MEKIRWGVAGTGYIANEFAKGMMTVEDGCIAAVCSRNADSGKAYAEKYNCSAVYEDFKQMLTEAKPDIVYLAIPNDCHDSYIRTALECGVPVLSEKPMVDTMKQFREVRALAKEKGLLLHEGMWTRCFPAVRQARAWMAEGKIGKPLTVRSSFDIKPAMDEWQPWKGGLKHAGGSLRDVGIYSLAMANMVFPGRPEKIFSTMKSNGEVDEACRLLMDYGNGQIALVGGAFNQIGTAETEIVGEQGRIVIGPEFWHPTSAVLYGNDGSREEFTDMYPATGFQYEIKAMQACLREGKTECADYTHAESELIAEQIEAARKEWGIIYKADAID